MLDLALRSVSVVAAIGLLLSVYHKGRLVSSGRHRSMAIFRTGSWSARHSLILIVAGGCAEVLLATALLAEPALGFAGLVALLAVYGAFIARMAPSAPCECFGALLPESRRDVALARNASLAVACAFASSAYLLDWARLRPIDATALGVSLILAAVVAAWSLLPRATELHSDAVSPVDRSARRH
jgi:hypothetical protein